MSDKHKSISVLLQKIRKCDICAEHLPLGPRPIVRASETTRLLIIGQAPGTRVHESGVPWDDPSGERLRDWLQIDAGTFYDESIVGLMPTGFCYPGTAPKGGDLPPRPECAPKWHAPLLHKMPNIELTLLVGSYAQKQHLIYKGLKPMKTLSETVKSWAEYAPDLLPLPHPSWRTLSWAKKNPWFEEEVLPMLRKRIQKLLAKQ